MLRTRRQLIQTLAIWPAYHVLRAARKEFWDVKDPSTWSDEEKRILLGQSPWSQVGSVRFAVERKNAQTSGSYGVARPGGDMPGARPGSIGGGVQSVPIGEPVPPVPKAEKGPPVQFTVLARWESAKPIRLAGGPALPEETAQFYVIRLRGMPLLPPPKAKAGEADPDSNPNQGMLEAIKQGSRLERKDKAGIPCAHLLTGSGEAATELLLFFPRSPDPITLADKLVTLDCRFSPFELSVKFPLKEMTYKGELTL